MGLELHLREHFELRFDTDRVGGTRGKRLSELESRIEEQIHRLHQKKNGEMVFERSVETRECETVEGESKSLESIGPYWTVLGIINGLWVL